MSSNSPESLPGNTPPVEPVSVEAWPSPLGHESAWDPPVINSPVDGHHETIPDPAAQLSDARKAVEAARASETTQAPESNADELGEPSFLDGVMGRQDQDVSEPIEITQPRLGPSFGDKVRGFAQKFSKRKDTPVESPFGSPWSVSDGGSEETVVLPSPLPPAPEMFPVDQVEQTEPTSPLAPIAPFAAPAPQPNPNTQPLPPSVPLHSLNGRLIDPRQYMPRVVAPSNTGAVSFDDAVEKERERMIVKQHAAQEAMVDQQNEQNAAAIKGEEERRSRLPEDEQRLESDMDMIADRLEAIYISGKENGRSDAEIQTSRERLVVDFVRSYGMSFADALRDAGLTPGDDRPVDNNGKPKLDYLIGPYEYTLDAPYVNYVSGVSKIKWSAVGKQQVWVVHTLGTRKPAGAHPSMITGPNFQDSGLAVGVDGKLYNCQFDSVQEITSTIFPNRYGVDGNNLSVNAFNLLKASLLTGKVGTTPDGRNYYNVARKQCTDILVAKRAILSAYGKR